MNPPLYFAHIPQVGHGKTNYREESSVLSSGSVNDMHVGQLELFLRFRLPHISRGDPLDAIGTLHHILTHGIQVDMQDYVNAMMVMRLLLVDGDEHDGRAARNNKQQQTTNNTG